MSMSIPRMAMLWLMLAVALVGLAMLRPIDHDESQYVAATVLAWQGLPYRDFAYLQTPLQPLLFAPIAALGGVAAYPLLRAVNALLGAVAVAGCYAAARTIGVGRPTAMLAATALATCDIVLFSASVVRNDALPAALLAWAIVLMLQAARGQGTRLSALMIGLLLSAALAAKISYALPAVAYGLVALVDRRHRPAWVVAGVAPMAALVGALWLAAPAAFAFEVFSFPTRAPAQWYLSVGRPEKIGLVSKLTDTVKFLALGPGILALAVWAWRGARDRGGRMLDVLIVAGAIAALLPEPTWRQYLWPLLIPLFVRLAVIWQARPPQRTERILLVVLGCAGLSPSVAAIASGLGGQAPMVVAIAEGRAIADALGQAKVTGPVATLSPQFVTGPGLRIDPRFAAGPFYFRSDGLLDRADERAFTLVSARHLADALDGKRPAAILVGGEGRWSSGDDRIDARLERYAIDRGWHRVPIASHRFRLYVRL